MICTRQHYTPTCYKRFRILYHGKRQERLAKQAANIWKDLPPVAKGEMLLSKWEEESETCHRCGYVHCECD